MARSERDADAGMRQSQIVAYAAAALGISILSAAANVVLPQLYAKELGIKLAQIGLALFVIRLVDSFSDQIVGYLSDRTRSRLGARKPWVIAGTAVSLLACYFLFIPRPGADVVYFFIWRLTYDVGWTMASVPYTAWGAEASPRYGDRSRLNGYSGMASSLGLLLKNVAPIVLFWMGLTRSSAFSLDQLGYLFWACLLAIPALTAWSVIATPSGRTARGERPNLRGMIGSLRGNKPFWIYLASFTLTSTGQGMLGLMFTLYDSYLKIGAFYPYIFIGFGIVSMVSIPLWVRLCNMIGKHRAHALAMLVNVIAIQGFWFINPATWPQKAVVALGTVILFLVAFGGACNYVAPSAILADVVDYATWKTRETRTGSYFAFNSLIVKLTTALGSGLGFVLLGAFAYNVKPGAVNSRVADMGLLFTVVLLPAVLKGVGGLIMLTFPLIKARHDILRRRIASRPVPGEHASHATSLTDPDLVLSDAT
jgi:GPH family glycoside/pentoside/hexuronide:cation symporter